MAVEILDDDAPPPAWDQWVNLPMPAPEPQTGALVTQWDVHMVAGGSSRGVEASSSRAALLAWARSVSTSRPPSSTPRRSSSFGRMLTVNNCIKVRS
jgi:hypothetical protein